MLKLLPILLLGCFLTGSVQAQCDTAFSVTKNEVTAWFQAVDSSLTVSHQWKFGDGTQGWGRNVSHTYSLPGTYIVKHIVVDTINNCRDSSLRTITISFSTSCAASFVAKKDSITPNKYLFTSTSTAGGGSILSYKWTINGDTINAGAAFIDTLLPGFNIVCLTIKTTTGCTASTCDSIFVDTTTHCNWSASFTYAYDSINSSKVRFTPSPAIPGLSYGWNFGDGFISYIPSPTHTYSNPGTYPVTLTVTDSAAGCFDTTRKYVIIIPKQPDTCTASFTYTVNPSQTNQYSFTAISSDSVVSYHWMIRPCDSTSTDSVTYNTANPVHTFTSAGCYRVCLYLIYKNGCRRSYCDTVMVNYNPAESLITSFPNPVNSGNVQLRLDLVQPAKVKVTVYNSFGHSVFTNERNYSTGQSRIGIPVDKLQRGLYYIDIQYGNTRKRSVFQKL